MTTEFKNIPTNVKIMFTIHKKTWLNLKIMADDLFVLLATLT